MVFNKSKNLEEIINLNSKVNDIQTNELRWKHGANIMKYIQRFSATEKVIFGIIIITTIVTAMLMAISVSNYFSIDKPSFGGTIQEGLIGLPRNINPIIAITPVDKDISALVYSGLMKFSNGELVPDLAQSYTISKDGLTYSFKIKAKAKFQDNTPLTAEDIAFTIQKVQDPALKSPRRIDWSDVIVKVISENEIQFVLKQPYSPFLVNTTIGIIPKHIWNSVSNEQFIFSQYNIEPIGSGPYKISSISHDRGGIPTKYFLKTWNNYYSSKPFIEKIVLSFFIDEESALLALDQNIITSLPSISPESATRLTSNQAQSYKVISSSLPRIFGVFFNQNQSIILADPNIRKALDLSIDRQVIINQVLKGYGTPIDSPLASTTKTYEISRIEIAKNLLEKNGWVPNSEGIYEKKASGKNPALTLAFDIYTADSPDLIQTAELIKKSWTALGAKISVKIYSSNDLYQNIIRTRKYDALLFGQAVGKDRDLYAFWHSSQRNAPGLNIANYANSKVDKLLEEIRTSLDEKTYKEKYTQFENIIKEDLPAVFIYTPDFIYAVPKSIQNVNLGTINTASDRWNNQRVWYIKTEKVWKFLVKD